MSVYDNTPEAFERYQRKQAEVAAWARHAPTHQTASAPGWQTPTQPPFSPGRHGHLTPHTLSQQPSSPLSRSLSNRDSWHDERSYGSHASSRHQDIPIPTGFVHQPSSKARTSSESRNWEGQCSMERSRMMDYVPSPLSTTYLPSPTPSRYTAAPAIPSAPITLAPRAGPHRASTTSPYSPVNEWPSGNQFPPGFVPHGPAVASSVPIIRSDSSRSSSAPSVAIVSATPPQAAFLSQAYSENSSRRAPSRSLSYGPGYTRSPSNSTAAMSYPSSEAQYRRFATSGRRSIMASEAAGREGRHALSRLRSISPASSDKTYDAVAGAQRHHDRVAVSQTDNAWLASQLPANLVPLVAQATHLAAQEHQRQQLGIPPSQAVNPHCPFREFTLDPGASMDVDGCPVFNHDSVRRTYLVYSQDDLGASLGKRRVEVVKRGRQLGRA